MQKAALVTGGAKRIGKSIAIKLAQMGYNIALHYNNSDHDAQETKNEIEKLNVNCKLFKADFLDATQTLNLLDEVKKEYKNLNLIVNNASVFHRESFKNTDLNLLNITFDINFKAPFILINKFANLFKEGHIINILDTKISKNNSMYSVYTLSKKSLANLTLMTAKELAPNIRVNAISPGLILPSDTKDENFGEISKIVPLNKTGNVTNITDAIAFLINNDYITGQILYIDGGQAL